MSTMYIACPKCDTKFSVTAEQIGKNGKKVRCSKCSNIWLQKPGNNVRIAPLVKPPKPSARPTNTGVNLPALLPIRSPQYTYMMPILMISLIALMMLILFPNKIDFIKDLEHRNLAVKSIYIDHQKESNKIIVNYSIHNSSDKNVNIPLVRVRLLDKNNNILKTIITNHRAMNIEEIGILPNQSTPMRVEFDNIPPQTENVDIMIGNKIDFILR